MSNPNMISIADALNKRFNITMESEQEIEITTDEVVINQVTTIDGEMDELSEDVKVVTESDENLDKVDEASATLESLILSMESSIILGGFNKQNANLANIALESVSIRFKLDADALSFGMEAVEDDAEGATKSTVDKAKQMLSALKSNTGALLNKMYMGAASALGNTAAISAKLISKATSLKANINSANKGGNSVKVGSSVARKLSVTGAELAPDAYIKELKRALDKYKSVVKTYADTDVLNAFIKDAVSKNAKSGNSAAVKKSVLASVKALSEGITKQSKDGGDSESYVSDAYLGGILIARTRPTVAAISTAMESGVKKDQVSQEGVLRAIGGGIKTIIGAMLFIFSVGTYINVISTAVSMTAGAMAGGVGGAYATVGVSGAMLGSLGVGSLLVSYGVLFLVGFLALKGAELGVSMITKNTKITADEFNKAMSMGKSKTKSSYSEAAEVSTAFSLTADKATAAETKGTVTSLSSSQVGQVTSLIVDTSATTKTMKAAAEKRKSVIQEVNELTKNLSTENGKETKAMAEASATFIKNWIKQTLKFEMEMTNYAVGIMKAALIYAEVSNSATVSTETILEDDGVENPEILEDVTVTEDTASDVEADVTVFEEPEDVVLDDDAVVE